MSYFGSAPLHDSLNWLFPGGLPTFIDEPWYFLVFLLFAVLILKGIYKGLSNFIEKATEKYPFSSALVLISVLLVALTSYYRHYLTLVLALLVITGIALLHLFQPTIARQLRVIAIQIVLVIAALASGEVVKWREEVRAARSTKAYVSLMFENVRELGGLEERELREMSRDLRKALVEVLRGTSIEVEPHDYPQGDAYPWWTRVGLEKKYPLGSDLPRIVLCNSVSACQDGVRLLSLVTRPVPLDKYHGMQCSWGDPIDNRGEDEDVPYLTLHTAYRVLSEWEINSRLGLGEKERQRVRKNILEYFLGIASHAGWDDLVEEAKVLRMSKKVSDEALRSLFQHAEKRHGPPACNNEERRRAGLAKVEKLR